MLVLHRLGRRQDAIAELTRMLSWAHRGNRANLEELLTELIEQPES